MQQECRKYTDPIFVACIEFRFLSSQQQQMSF